MSSPARGVLFTVSLERKYEVRSYCGFALSFPREGFFSCKNIHDPYNLIQIGPAKDCA
ncbi:hypothetical protein Back11_37850 [Paenibacillus baekrokdamisoli]|uniref:Uncharacterized protein n=1 Tax=Paenibacillus baekrokdamisoli TaxID=1712516 RepID=A0A3G9IU88_9BACL|nr:hypothetical protein [Paenibacillus baekrokdamisoli]BBH22440.1 hypothetical protein Back11_37850 [Paenibacillus baekrokdamisoli]